MPSRSKLPGRTAPPTPSATQPERDFPPAASGLSSAFSQALGGRTKPGGQPVAGSGFTARDTVRQARLDGPATAKGAQRQPRIGPRSGHK